MFEEIGKDIVETYKKNHKEKGDSWETMPIKFLENKFEEELKEFRESSGRKDTYQELIDVLIVGLMLANRLKGGGRNSSQD